VEDDLINFFLAIAVVGLIIWVVANIFYGALYLSFDYKLPIT
jgi:hypothetical protein